MRYGLGYMGSKPRIADGLALAIHDRGVGNFYDLFAGGCAMTHRMMSRFGFAVQKEVGRKVANG